MEKYFNDITEIMKTYHVLSQQEQTNLSTFRKLFNTTKLGVTKGKSFPGSLEGKTLGNKNGQILRRQRRETKKPE